MNEDINAELELLRDFFAKWENFHQIANKKEKQASLAAAQRMVACAEAYRQYKEFHASEFTAGHG